MLADIFSFKGYRVCAGTRHKGGEKMLPELCGDGQGKCKCSIYSNQFFSATVKDFIQLTLN